MTRRRPEQELQRASPKPPPSIPTGIVADQKWPGLYRVKLGRGRLSDIVNLARAKDAALWRKNGA
jgi:hypothetical protein